MSDITFLRFYRAIQLASDCVPEINLCAHGRVRAGTLLHYAIVLFHTNYNAYVEKETF